MPAPTPSLVKNIIQRSFREVIDPSPSKTEITRVWEYFSSKCAYCGKKLNRTKKEGHIDHLVPSTLGGANHISNRVLSCSTCNEKGKRDGYWLDFIKNMNSDKAVAKKRKSKINEWQKMNPWTPPDKSILDKIDSLSGEIGLFYDKKIKKAKKLIEDVSTTNNK